MLSEWRQHFVDRASAIGHGQDKTALVIPRRGIRHWPQSQKPGPVLGIVLNALMDNLQAPALSSLNAGNGSNTGVFSGYKCRLGIAGCRRARNIGKIAVKPLRTLSQSLRMRHHTLYIGRVAALVE